MSRSSGYRRLVGEALRFGLVGLVATAVHIGVGLLFLGAGLHPFLANAFGFATALSVSLAGHHWFTFETSAPFARTASRYTLVAFLGFGFNNLVLATLISLLPPPMEAVSLVVAVLLTPLATFAAARLFAYRD